MISKSLKWMLRRDSPLYIRPSLDPVFVKFMIGMWRSCTASAQRAGFEANLRLAHGTVEAYEDYRADGARLRAPPRRAPDGLHRPGEPRAPRDHPRPGPALRPRPAAADRRRGPRARAEAVRRGLRRDLLPPGAARRPERVDALAAPTAGRARGADRRERPAGRGPDRARPDHRDHRRGGAPHRRRVRARRRPLDRPVVQADRRAASRSAPARATASTPLRTGCAAPPTCRTPRSP